MSTASVSEDAVESDARLLFIYTYLTKTTKFKVDKWQKMMNTEAYKVSLRFCQELIFVVGCVSSINR